ncbi:DgyrCDS6379 [Dimorphilus gyrociliatus]|uniref:DgyrCDS6379 n=1 Tax=Dimorphilus gyrociliatus TaxID=2664684 RepID=A0A7I8VQ72_9ANNE|nr:DgyrCDS6379 [Dimorphilus gyrociliatus]
MDTYVKFLKDCTCYSDRSEEIHISAGTEAKLIESLRDNWSFVCKIGETRSLRAPSDLLELIYKTVVEVDAGIERDHLSSPSQEIHNAEHVSTIEVAEDTIEGGSTSKNLSEPTYVNTEEIKQMKKLGGTSIITIGEIPPKPKPKPAPRQRPQQFAKNNNTATSPHPQTSYQAQTKQTPDSSPGNTLERSVTSDYGSDNRSSSSSPAKLLDDDPLYANTQLRSDNSTFHKKKSMAPPPPKPYVEREHLEPEKSKVQQISPNSQSPPPPPLNSFGVPYPVDATLQYNRNFEPEQERGSSVSSVTEDLPEGWSRVNENGHSFLIHPSIEGKWNSSVDPSGKMYYYNLDTQHSEWKLPIPDAKGFDKMGFLSTPVPRRGHPVHRVKSTSSRTKPVIQPKTKQGTLAKTKISDNNKKKIKKNWTSVFAVTQGSKLCFYKENKKSSLSSPTSCSKEKMDSQIELCKAEVVLVGDKSSESSRKYIVKVTSPESGTFLLSAENTAEAQDWFETLNNNSHLPFKLDGIEDSLLKATNLSSSMENLPGASQSPILDKKSKKDKKRGNSSRENTLERKQSVEEKGGGAGGGGGGGSNSKFRDFLSRFITRRPNVEQVKAKGILKDPLIFGSTIESICERENSLCPKFIEQCIAAIEKKGLQHDGIYRLSGNQAEIQSVRWQIDQQQDFCLDDVQDINVLTGALKLFFRELSEPLIPYEVFDEMIEAMQLTHNEKLAKIQSCINKLPECRLNTFSKLIIHLRRVLELKGQNRMQAQSIAIVFGPNLMWQKEKYNLTNAMTNANYIMDLILSENLQFPQ